MKHRILFHGTALTISSLIFLAVVIAPGRGHGEILKLINGDQYHGRVARVDETRVVFESEIQGRLELSRSKVAVIVLQEEAVKSLSKPSPDETSSDNTEEGASKSPSEGLDALRQRGGKTSNAVDAVQQQFLQGASPEAVRQYRQMVSGLMDGSLSITDIRQRAKESAAQIRRFRGDFEEAGPILDNYLRILEGFVQKTAPSGGARPEREDGEATPEDSKQENEAETDRSEKGHDERANQD